MSWWYVSSPRMTCAVELDGNEYVVAAPPILSNFVGQPAKNLGAWLRNQGECRFERVDHVYQYSWGNNPKRATLKGRTCRVVARGEMRSVMVEFENGQREIVSYRALRERRT